MDASGNGVAPFAIDQGIVKILNARIQGALIDDLVVKTSNIEPGAVTRFFTASGGANIAMTVNHGLGSPTVKIEYKAKVNTVGEFGSVSVTLSNATDGVNIEVAGGSSPQVIFSSVLFTPPPDRESTIFRLVTQSQNSTVSGQTLFAYVFKR